MASRRWTILKKIRYWLLLGMAFSLALILVACRNPPTHVVGMLNVPLENQNDSPRLENGCEITALSMLLRYHGYQTNKNQLANLLDYVPFSVNEHFYGDPHDGFVGDIKTGINAMGVAIEPLAKVAQQVVSQGENVKAGHDVPFSTLREQIKKQVPVLVLITVDFKKPKTSDFLDWPTENGNMRVCRLCHAAVVVGIDKHYVYVNDPYGQKNRRVSIKRFKNSYRVMSRQALYLEE